MHLQGLSEAMRKIVTASKRPDLLEITHLCLEALVKWSNSSSSATEDLNMALEELRKVDIEIKYVEKSLSSDESLNLFMTDGTSYRLSIRRTDNSFR